MKPIIMSTEDVRALLDGRKTMVRLAIKPQPTHWYNGERVYDKDSIVGPEFYAPVRVDKNGEQYPGKEVYGIYSDDGGYGCKAPCQPGDVLYVRETWKPEDYQLIDGVWSCAIVYKVGGLNGRVHWPEGSDSIYDLCLVWHSPVAMPREAARLFLRVTDVRVERVQDISEEDAKAEGVYAKDNGSGSAYRSGYRELWNKLNKKRGHDWYTNDWVWVIRFERVEKGAEL